MPSTEAPATPPPAERDAATVATIAAAGLGGVLSIAAFAVYDARTALSVAAGATIAVANLVTMSAIIRALLKPGEDAAAGEAGGEGEREGDASEADANVDHVAEGKRGGAAWGAFAAIKILVLFGGIYVLLTRGWVDPIPLVVGYGVLPLGIAASGLSGSLAPKRRRKSR